MTNPYNHCRFCDLEQNQPGRVLTTHTHVVVIASDPRLMLGHLLVIPKRHVERLHDLSCEERTELFDVVIALQQRILERFASGCDIRQHNRPFLPENNLKVDHVHIHLQPREMEDELYQKCQRFDRDIFQPIPDGELDSIKEKLF